MNQTTKDAVPSLLPCPFCGDEGEKGQQTVSQMTGVLPPLENPNSYRTSANAYTQWECDHAEENRLRVAGVKNEFVRLTCRVCGAMCPQANWNRRSAPVAPTPAVQAEAVPQLKPRLLNQLRRFNECCEDPDAGGHDVDREDMHSLAEMGAVRPAPGGRHYLTDFGHYLLTVTAPSTGEQA